MTFVVSNLIMIMMKKDSLEESYSIAEIENRLMVSFDILRGQMDVGSFYVLLYLLILKRDGILEDLTSNQPNESIFDLIRAINRYIAQSDNEVELRKINEVFEPTIKLVSSKAMFELLLLFNSMNSVDIKSYFPSIFDNLLYTITKFQGKSSGGFLQPAEITRFICRFANINQYSKVFNPFAGLASFDVLSDLDYNYFGQEYNQTIWALGILRLMAYNRLDSSKYVNVDSIEYWPLEDQKFDLIISTPPLHANLSNKYKGEYPEIRTAEQFLIEKGISSLNVRGKLIAVLSNGFLFKGGVEQRLRERLIERDLIETIISLPGGLMLNTGIPIIILIINKNKELVNKVRIIDAKNFTLRKGKKEIILNDEALSAVLNNNQDSESVRIISTDQIRHLNYNLNVPRYFLKEIEGVLLSDILETTSINRISMPETGKLVKIKDLKEDDLSFKLDLRSVDNMLLNKTGIKRVEESCLLLSLRWRTLKPTCFEYTGTPIYLNQDILPFKINENDVDINYLVNELKAEYIREQLDAFRVGTIPFIKRNDLLAVRIKLPSLNEQIAKMQGVEELSSKIKELQKERNALAHGQSNANFNEFASLKHTLGRPRQNILDWSDNLLDFLTSKENELASVNKEFVEFYEIDILTALKEIKRDINFISEVLEKGEDGFVFNKGKYPKSLVSLAEINSIVKELSSNGFNFKIKKNPFKGELLKSRGVECNITLLKILIDNLFTNANKHAFSKEKSNNEVVIELSEVKGFLELEIRNNGNPFPKNIDKEKFITKYSTSNSKEGSGLGGYDINRIAEYLENPDWELILNENPIYKVRFKFRFPIKLIK